MRNNILINGLNSTSAGGKSIFINFIKLLVNDSLNDNYYVLTSSTAEFQEYQNPNVTFVMLPSLWGKLLPPLAYEFSIGKLINKFSIDLVFNMGDLIINTGIKQLYLFDWAYAVYPEHRIWDDMDLKSKLSRKIKVFLIKNRIREVDIVISQTKVIKKRLMDIYKISNVEIVPNAVSLDNLNCEDEYDFQLPIGKRLLYLTRYYPHKNLEVFLPLARMIKKQQLDFKIVITISKNQHSGSRLFLDQIEKENLGDTIVNIGPVKMEQVPSLYRQCNGLLMPTLLESFSGTYVEAMHHNIPIFTSKLDFAVAVCSDAAYYFDPLSHDSIFLSITSAFNNSASINEKILKGKRLLSGFPHWQDTYLEYKKLISSILKA